MGHPEADLGGKGEIKRLLDSNYPTISGAQLFFVRSYLKTIYFKLKDPRLATSAIPGLSHLPLLNFKHFNPWQNFPLQKLQHRASTCRNMCETIP